ncbi:GATA zinc finger domain-containing protein 16 [Zancudomyces culisetae]|uniref:GATA zinc finger domain-containing protein 16 n=1 Tax=Zancudomyces culisetae TaxID=1213189 RepID=A0A1R1PVZ9_ZANCU|nr:GATA zinc finger domain-containing protein 16 [Zancudomyces culisetae]|eukprot:OMH85083.1 GATA zinc finger domain-containing protein 16 [Zancudomyces culisetae]
MTFKSTELDNSNGLQDDSGFRRTNSPVGRPNGQPDQKSIFLPQIRLTNSKGLYPNQKFRGFGERRNDILSSPKNRCRNRRYPYYRREASNQPLSTGNSNIGVAYSTSPSEGGVIPLSQEINNSQFRTRDISQMYRDEFRAYEYYYKDTHAVHRNLPSKNYTHHLQSQEQSQPQAQEQQEQHYTQQYHSKHSQSYQYNLHHQNHQHQKRHQDHQEQHQDQYTNQTYYYNHMHRAAILTSTEDTSSRNAHTISNRTNGVGFTSEVFLLLKDATEQIASGIKAYNLDDIQSIDQLIGAAVLLKNALEYGKKKNSSGCKLDLKTYVTRTCQACHTTSTPEWRKGPLGPRTLCNACGLIWSKFLKKQAQEERRNKRAYVEMNGPEDLGTHDSFIAKRRSIL